MIFSLASDRDREAVLRLYRSVLGRPYCVWNEEYPGMEEILHDTETGNLFLLREGDALVGAVSILPENELDKLPFWHQTQGAAEIARVVIAPEHQGKGYARILVSHILTELESRGCPAAHLAVAQKNLPAYRTYQGLGFVTVGEAHMYGDSYYLCEKPLSPR